MGHIIWDNFSSGMSGKTIVVRKTTAQPRSLAEMHKVSVLGKGERVREVPLLASTLAGLELHYQDRLALVKAGSLPAHFVNNIAREQAPVLSVLRVQKGRGRERRGLTPASAPRVPSYDGRLDNKTLYGILKAFFKKVGQRSDLVHGHADFERASTRWLRHTFALQFLAANPGDLPALQGLLGHEDLSTTGIYVRAALGHRARGVAKMERFFLICGRTQPMPFGHKWALWHSREMYRYRKTGLRGLER